MGQRFSECFVLKFALEERAEKRENANFYTKHTESVTRKFTSYTLSASPFLGIVPVDEVGSSEVGNHTSPLPLVEVWFGWFAGCS